MKEIQITDRLCDLDWKQIDHLSLGLTHNFGCILWPDMRLTSEETSATISLDPETTVGKVWELAESDLKQTPKEERRG